MNNVSPLSLPHTLSLSLALVRSLARGETSRDERTLVLASSPCVRIQS